MALPTTKEKKMKIKGKQNISKNKIKQELLLEKFLEEINKIKNDLKKEEEGEIKILVKILNNET